MCIGEEVIRKEACPSYAITVMSGNLSNKYFKIHIPAILLKQIYSVDTLVYGHKYICT